MEEKEKSAESVIIRINGGDLECEFDSVTCDVTLSSESYLPLNAVFDTITDMFSPTRLYSGNKTIIVHNVDDVMFRMIIARINALLEDGDYV